MFGGLSENAVCQQNVIYFNISAVYSAELIDKIKVKKRLKLTKSAIYSSNRGVQFKPFY